MTKVVDKTAKKVLTLAQIDGMIASIIKKATSLRDDAHVCLVGIVDHYIDNGDYTRLPKLVEAVNEHIGNSMAKSMVTWVANYVTSLTWELDANGRNGKFVHIPKTAKLIKDIVIKDAAGKVTFEGNARDYPFYNLEVKTEVKPFDLASAVAALIKRAERAYEANTKEGAHNIVNHAAIDVLKSINIDTLLKVTDEPEEDNDNTQETQKLEEAKPAKARRTAKTQEQKAA